MGNKWTNIFGCKATSRLDLMGCGFGLYFLALRLYFVRLLYTVFWWSTDFSFKKEEKNVVLVNNPPLNYSKSLEEYGVGWFGGCEGMCQTISPLSCYASLHTKLRLLGHLCLCSVARPPCTDACFTQSYLPRTFQDPTDVLPTFYPPRDPKAVTPVPSCLLLILTPQKCMGHFTNLSYSPFLKKLLCHHYNIETDLLTLA